MNRVQWIKYGIMNGYTSNNVDPDAFITTWNITAGNIILNSVSVGYNNCTVDWGDGTTSQHIGNNPTHTYLTNGQYKISITGQYSGFSDLSSADKLISVNQWGNVGFYSLTAAFAYCSNLVNLPNGAITGVNNVTDLGYCFNNCKSLTSIPSGLFDNCINVTNFGGCFNNCKSLTSIPSGLFDNCVNVMYFNSCFSDCRLLASIPNLLFDKCIKVASFRNCFCYCSKLILPTTLFNLSALQTQKPNMVECFFNDSTTYSPTGTIQPIWNYITITSNNACFYNCTGISNYSSIPSMWKSL